MTQSYRLISLDVFRGITIALMILVNMAGVADYIYKPFDHAAWHGWTLADLVFPFFLFAVGMSVSLSFRSRSRDAVRIPFGRILQRTAIIFGLGLFLNGFYQYDFSSIRLMGVLQRIAVVYFFVALIGIKLNGRAQYMLAVGILIGYWIALCFIPVPDHGVGILTRQGNFGSFIDSTLISRAHLYNGDFWAYSGDPEGLFSTLPAVVSALIGYFAGNWLERCKTDSSTGINLFFIGLTCLVAGLVWSQWFPINKKLWTSSYVLFTGGMALMLFAACYEWVEVRKERKWAGLFEVMGVNSIVAFTASVLMIKIFVKTSIGNVNSYEWFNTHVFVSWLGPLNGPTVFAVLTVIFWWIVLFSMRRQGWVIKV